MNQLEALFANKRNRDTDGHPRTCIHLANACGSNLEANIFDTDIIFVLRHDADGVDHDSMPFAEGQFICDQGWGCKDDGGDFPEWAAREIREFKSALLNVMPCIIEAESIVV